MGNLSLDALTTGSHNVALGHEALTSATTSGNNTAVGSEALEDATTGGSNTAIGRQALASNTVASANTAVGYNALVSNITGSSNTAVGYRAGYANTSAQELTVVGYDAALYSLGNSTTAFGRNAMRGVSGASTGANNTGLGESALRDYTTATGNTAVGKNSMLVTTTGSNNVAVGYGSLDRNTTGYSNVMIGRDAGGKITTGYQNVAVGYEALRDTASSAGNTAVGYEAGREITTAVNNTMLGYRAGHSLTAGNGRNTLIGFDAGRDTTGDHNAFFGKDAGYLVTSGSKNTIVGSYSGNQGGLDIRTSSNRIVLSDGDGNPRLISNGGGRWGAGINPDGIGGVGVARFSAKSTSNGHFAAAFEAYYGVGINAVTATGALMYFYYNGIAAPVGSINTNGTSVSFNTSSDYRLKENVVAISGATERLKQLAPKRFNFIVDADTTVDGFLAHEVQTVVPEAITGTHNEVDDDGNAIYQGIDQSKLVPLLVATIQELEARIAALESN